MKARHWVQFVFVLHTVIKKQESSNKCNQSDQFNHQKISEEGVKRRG